MTGDSQQPVCSVVIRAYNEAVHLPRLLDGLLQQTVKDIQIVLVDSGSTDGTLAVAERYPVEIVQIQPGEFSFGRSLNLGLSRCTAEFVVIASAHVYPVYPDWLERLLAPLADERLALAYGKQRGNHLTKFSEQQIFAHWYPEHSNLSQAHPFCNNANAAIRRSLWEQHPYDEALSGLEDVAWAHWALDQGYRLAYVAEAEIVHVHTEAPAGVYNRYRREAMAFKGIYPQESFHFLDFLRLVFTNIASDLWQAARLDQLIRSAASIFWFRWMQFWGTYQGYRHPGPLTWHLRQTFYYPRWPGQVAPPAGRDVQPIRYDQ